MGEIKKIKAKFIPKHEKEVHWLQSSYIPDEGEMVLYDPDENYEYTRVKYGDGKRTITELPFDTSSLPLGAGLNSIQQPSNGTQDGLDFTGRNPNAALYDTDVEKWNAGVEKVPYGASGDYSFAQGGKSAAYAEGSHAEGKNSIAKGSGSHAEGESTVSIGASSHSEGLSTVTKGEQSHAEGSNTTAIGKASHAEGFNTIAEGLYAHAEGNNTKAKGMYAHAEGDNNTAEGKASHVSGAYNKAQYEHQFVAGVYNQNKEDNLLEIGAGTGEADRSNAFEVKRDGHVKVAMPPEQKDDVLRLGDLVHADYDENNPESVTYIENRPFYEKGYSYEFSLNIREQESFKLLEGEYQFQNVVAYLQSTKAYSLEEILDAEWQGSQLGTTFKGTIDESCIKDQTSSGLTLFMRGTNSEFGYESFLGYIVVVYDTNYVPKISWYSSPVEKSMPKIGTYFIDCGEGDEYIYYLKKDRLELKKLDNKFLDLQTNQDLIKSKADYNENDENSLSYIKNRPFYDKDHSYEFSLNAREQESFELLESEGEYYYTVIAYLQSTKAHSLEEILGAECKGRITGTEFKGTIDESCIQDQTSSGLTLFMRGVNSEFGWESTVGYIVVAYDTNYVPKITWNSKPVEKSMPKIGTYLINCNTGDEYIYYLKKDNRELKKLDNKFLDLQTNQDFINSKADYNENDENSLSYIKNRPFYEEAIPVTLNSDMASEFGVYTNVGRYAGPSERIGLVSTEVYKASDLLGKTIKYQYIDWSSTLREFQTVIQESHIAEYSDCTVIHLSGPITIVLAKKDNCVIQNDEIYYSVWSIPQKGTYLTTNGSIYDEYDYKVTSLSFNKIIIHPIDNKYINLDNHEILNKIEEEIEQVEKNLYDPDYLEIDIWGTTETFVELPEWGGGYFWRRLYLISDQTYTPEQLDGATVWGWPSPEPGKGATATVQSITEDGFRLGGAYIPLYVAYNTNYTVEGINVPQPGIYVELYSHINETCSFERLYKTYGTVRRVNSEVLPLANGTTRGAVKTSSKVTDVYGYHPTPIVDGIPYYKNTEYFVASAYSEGLVKTGYTKNGRNYPVKLDYNNRMYVEVPDTQVNADYEEKNSDTAAYIKNRPFYMSDLEVTQEDTINTISWNYSYWFKGKLHLVSRQTPTVEQLCSGIRFEHIYYFEGDQHKNFEIPIKQEDIEWVHEKVAKIGLMCVVYEDQITANFELSDAGSIYFAEKGIYLGYSEQYDDIYEATKLYIPDYEVGKKLENKYLNLSENDDFVELKERIDTFSPNTIVDVDDLPIENIDKSIFYREKKTKKYCDIFYGGAKNYLENIPIQVICVDSLPESGIPFVDIGAEVRYLYLNNEDSKLYLYAINEISDAPTGWYDFLELSDFTWAIIATESEVVRDDVFYILPYEKEEDALFVNNGEYREVALDYNYDKLINRPLYDSIERVSISYNTNYGQEIWLYSDNGEEQQKIRRVSDRVFRKKDLVGAKLTKQNGQTIIIREEDLVEKSGVLYLSGMDLIIIYRDGYDSGLDSILSARKPLRAGVYFPNSIQSLDFEGKVLKFLEDKYLNLKHNKDFDEVKWNYKNIEGRVTALENVEPVELTWDNIENRPFYEQTTHYKPTGSSYSLFGYGDALNIGGLGVMSASLLTTEIPALNWIKASWIQLKDENTNRGTFYENYCRIGELSLFETSGALDFDRRILVVTDVSLFNSTYSVSLPSDGIYSVYYEIDMDPAAGSTDEYKVVSVDLINQFKQIDNVYLNLVEHEVIKDILSNRMVYSDPITDTINFVESDVSVDVKATHPDGTEAPGKAYFQTSKTYSKQELIGAIQESSSTGSIHADTITPSSIIQETSDGLTIYSYDSYIYVAYTTNYWPKNLVKAAFPRPGIYFSYTHGGDYWVKSLSIFKNIKPLDIDLVDVSLTKPQGFYGLQQTADNCLAGISAQNCYPNAQNYDANIKEWHEGKRMPYGAIGDFSTAFGGKSSAQGKRSLAEGTTTLAFGSYSHAEGSNTVAYGTSSHSEGVRTFAYEQGSHAEGEDTQALGRDSHAEGYGAVAQGEFSHAEGYFTQVYGESSHAEGASNRVYGKQSHAEGYDNIIGDETKIGIVGNGDFVHVGGAHNSIYANDVFAHGRDLIIQQGADGSVVFGINNNVEGTRSVAFGINNFVNGVNNTVFGTGIRASTKETNQLLVGQYNLERYGVLFAVGNGSSNDSRASAFEVYKNGRASVQQAPFYTTDVVRLSELTKILPWERNGEEYSRPAQAAEGAFLRWQNGSPKWVILDNAEDATF